eukprot:TRINITY_DN13745_c0_g2_i1.p1 TRINITY_DN13745_c0_g2~~TRINITY_DN13745_c0_g2_i1.p1  ORF type:complete len:151 (+),score=33.04 TRINITY_DN13745_c0_g2_i1:726-1178(+)
MITVPIGTSEPYFRVKSSEIDYSTLSDMQPCLVKHKENRIYELRLVKSVEVEGDVLIECFDKGIVRRKKLFGFWFNTRFVSEDGVLVIRKRMLDSAYRDKKNKKFDKNFRVEVEFSPAIPINNETGEEVAERLLKITESVPLVYSKLSLF